MAWTRGGWCWLPLWSPSLPLRRRARLSARAGTAHYFLVHAVTVTVRHEVGLTRGVGRQAVFVALNAAIFAIPAVLLYLTRARIGRWYSRVGLFWTAVFLLSCFFIFPTVDCP